MKKLVMSMIMVFGLVSLISAQQSSQSEGTDERCRLGKDRTNNT
jgi:hypothetical protein